MSRRNRAGALEEAYLPTSSTETEESKRVLLCWLPSLHLPPCHDSRRDAAHWGGTWTMLLSSHRRVTSFFTVLLPRSGYRPHFQPVRNLRYVPVYPPTCSCASGLAGKRVPFPSLCGRCSQQLPPEEGGRCWCGAVRALSECWPCGHQAQSVAAVLPTL